MAKQWRPRKVKHFPVQVQEIGAVIYLFLGVHARGLEIMLGEFPFPPTEELSSMLVWLRGSVSSYADLGVNIQTGGLNLYAQHIVESAERIEKIISNAGGIERFNVVFRDCQRKSSTPWRALVDWYKWVKIGRPPRGGKGDMWRLVQRYHVSETTLRNWREKLILQLADDIFNGRHVENDDSQGVA